MPDLNVEEYIELISQMRTLAYKMDYIINNINRYKMFISKGFIVNDNISFEKELENLKEVLTFKKNKIKNDIIPELYNSLNNR